MGIEENLRRAKQIINMDTNGDLNRYKGKAKQMYENYDMGYEEYNNAVPQMVNENIQPQYVNENTTSSKSKLPKEILESFANNPIDTSMLGATASVLDRLNLAPMKKEVIAEKREVIKETPQQAPIVANANIDYSMIKMIVEDCMKKYTSALKKSLINESKANDSNATLQALKIGNKFSFIDNSGNVYEATLKKVGNLNKNK